MSNDEKIVNLITEELNKNEVLKFVKKDKDFEKHIKTIIKDVVKDMFRVLWQHNDIFNTLSR